MRPALVRRLVGLVLALAFLPLVGGSAARACAPATTVATAPHHATGHDAHHSQSCADMPRPDCCPAVTGCASLPTLAVVSAMQVPAAPLAASPLPPLRVLAPASRSSAPEPPPPRA